MPLTQADLEARKQFIGASEVAAVLGVSPFKTAFEVWAEKTGRVEPFAGNKYTDGGNRFEPVVLDWAEEKLGALERNVVCKFGDAPVASTCDALTVERSPVEAKTAGLFRPLPEGWGEDGSDNVPDFYLIQCQAQMLCTGADVAHLAAFLGGRGFAMFTIQRSEKICKFLADFLPEWWNRHVVADSAPPMENTSTEVLKRLKREPKKIIEVTAEAAVRLERARAAESEAKKEVEAAQAALLAQMGDAEAADFGDPARLLTFYEQTRKAHHVNESKFRVFRFAKRS
jgi:putative phage-type endonuclease